MVGEILASNFTKIETYEDCPIDTDLIVWTGDSFEIEFVVMCCEYGTFSPANGVEFTHYARLPDGEDVESEAI